MFRDRLDDSLSFITLFDSNNSISNNSIIPVLRIANNNNRADTVVNTVIADASKLPVATTADGAKPAAPHDDSAESKTLNLETETLLHVMVLHDVDLVRNLRVAYRLRDIGGLGGGEGVEVILQLPLAQAVAATATAGVVVVVVDGGESFLLGVRVGVDGEVDGAPIGAEEDVGRADVEEDHGVAGADVVLYGPAYSVRAFIGEVNGDADLAAGAGGGGGSCGGGRVAWGGGVVDSDLWELRVRIQCGCGWVVLLGLHFLVCEGKGRESEKRDF